MIGLQGEGHWVCWQRGACDNASMQAKGRGCKLHIGYSADHFGARIRWFIRLHFKNTKKIIVLICVAYSWILKVSKAKSLKVFFARDNIWLCAFPSSAGAQVVQATAWCVHIQRTVPTVFVEAHRVTYQFALMQANVMVDPSSFLRKRYSSRKLSVLLCMNNQSFTNSMLNLRGGYVLEVFLVWLLPHTVPTVSVADLSQQNFGNSKRTFANSIGTQWP